MGDWQSLARIAWRDLRGSLGGFVLFFACTALGVATIAAVGVINSGVTRTVERDAAALLGGDIVIEQPNYRIDAADMPRLDVAVTGEASAVRTNGIAFGPDERSLAIELKAVAGAYPLYGAVETTPAQPLADLFANSGVIVEPSVLTRLDVDVGDTLRIGNGDVTIRAVLNLEPDRIGGYISLGPRVLLSKQSLSDLGVLAPGAVARFDYRFALEDPASAVAVKASIQQQNPDAAYRVRSTADVQPRVARFTDRLATYLMMAGLTALVIGGLGIGLSVRAYLHAKTATIATLRCIGAKSADVLTIYGLQIGTLAIGGALLGVIIGQLLPFALAPLVAGMLPVQVEPSIEVVPLVYAAFCGLSASVLFAVLPLLSTLDIRPASLFRVDLETGGNRHLTQAAVVGGLGLIFAGIIVLGAPRQEIALWFVASVIAVMLVLMVLARLFLALAKRLKPHVGPKLGLALGSLNQPGNGAVSVVVAMGAGLSALVMVGLLQHNLERELLSQLPDRTADLVFIDLQPDQVEAFRSEIDSRPDAEIMQIAPMLRARVTAIKGVPASEANVGEEARWTVRRDRGLTYQAEPEPGVELVLGEWWPADYDGEPLVSIDEDVWEGYGVDIGDKIAFNILGREVEARVANVREEIDWGAGRLAFVFVLSPGLIENAPHTTVVSVEVADGDTDALIQSMAKQFPNVTPIAIGDAIARVADILGKIGSAIRIVALITLVTGVLVLASAIVASRRQQIRRAVLLKVLGSQRSDILRLLLTEHAGLGLIAAAAGGTLGGIAAYILVGPVMDLSWSFSWPVVLITSVSAMLLAMLVGGFVLRRTLSVPAATILRQP